MNDIFGKVCSIFLAVIILFGMPLIYMSERAKTASQLYLLTVATHFVDGVCNTGRISGAMLEQLDGSLTRKSAVVDISLVHEQPEYVYDEENDTYVRCMTYHDEADIRESVAQGQDYLFSRGDFLIITLEQRAGFGLFMQGLDPTVSIRYGGTVKYEAY
jgi:hypothetical protein